jgi:hypothetical protein
MEMKLRWLPLILACVLTLSAPALAQDKDPPASGHPGGGGHFADGHGAWSPHPGWHGSIRSHWDGGHWWHGNYRNRLGWWWIVGPDWYWYPNAIYPYPNPYTPPEMASGYWYWCDTYQQYYPYVGACPSGWRPVQPH